VVGFELFRPELERAVPRADRAKGGRPPFDHILMFKGADPADPEQPQ
jgi:IS5 family transposase